MARRKLSHAERPSLAHRSQSVEPAALNSVKHHHYFAGGHSNVAQMADFAMCWTLAVPAPRSPGVDTEVFMSNRSRSAPLILTTLALAMIIPSVARADIITILAGDKDSLGTGITVGNPVILGSAVATASDGTAFDQRRIGEADWSYSYILPSDQYIVGASLTMLTYDVEDAGQCDLATGGECDDRLFLNGIEVAGAFDDVYTGNYVAAGPIPVPPNLVTFTLGPEFYAALATGILDVHLWGKDAVIWDHVWIDYAELQIETARVPEPSTLLLLFGGVATLGLSRLRRG
jgi:hypothetical protein